MADALLEELGSDFTIACPAFPENGRTIYLGHLFVGGDLLSDSSMRNHPLTPMRDANLVRVLGRQTKHKVGLVPYRTVKQGAPAIAEAYAALKAAGVRHAIVDALEDKDLENIGAASSALPLITGGSGVAIGLPASYRVARLIPKREGAAALAKVGGPGIVLSGSCSAATLNQVERFAASHPAHGDRPCSTGARAGEDRFGPSRLGDGEAQIRPCPHLCLRTARQGGGDAGGSSGARRQAR